MTDKKNSYNWSGLDRSGNRVTGVMSADDVKEIQQELKKRDIEVVSIKQKKAALMIFSKRKKKIKPTDILLFTRYLSTLISSGLPVLQAFDVISRDQENSTLQELIISLRTNIAGGKTLSESFMQHPQYFSKLYCNLIRSGEVSGTIEKILKRIGNYLERTESLKRKIKKALIYPIAILTVSFAVSLILLIFVVPRFEKVFSSFGAELPFFTQIVIMLSNFLQAYWWIVIAAIIGMIFGARYLIKNSEKVRHYIDLWSLKIAIFGPILKKAIIARFTRTLAITLDAGMPIVEALKGMPDLMGNSIYASAVKKINEEIISGNQLNVAMSNSKLFPHMAVQMVAIGEESGSLSEMLNKVADYYEEDVNGVVDNLSSLLEPVIMVILGIIVGGFIIAMYLPIFKLGSLF